MTADLKEYTRTAAGGFRGPRRVKLLILSASVALIVGLAALALLGSQTIGMRSSFITLAPRAEPLRVQAAVPANMSGQWVKPQAGWLYVLDTNDLREKAQIFLIDPTSGAIRGRIPTGYAPDMALSPDGARLYVASTYPGRSTLEVIDTTNGTVLYTAEIPYREIYALLPVWSRMAISPDGRWLYVNQLQIVAPGRGPAGDEYSVAIFDTQSHRFLPIPTKILGCPSALLVPAVQQGLVTVFCGEASDVRTLLAERGDPARGSFTVTRVATPAGSGEVAGAVQSGKTRSIYQVMVGGQVVTIDGSTGYVVRTVELALPSGLQVVKGSVALSPDGNRLYAGLRSSSSSRKLQAQQLLVVDTTTWKTLHIASLSQPFSGVAVSADGSRIYTLNPDGGSVLELDSTTYVERVAITGLSTYPGLIRVVP